MKKQLFIIVALAFSVAFTTANAQNEQQKTDKTRIVLVNPGVFYLKSLAYLTDNKIIDIKNLEYQAVFYTKAEISYDEAADYIKKNNIGYITLKKVEGDLNIHNLYKKNACSKSFKEIFKNSDGVIFLGGWDIPPVLYGQETSLLAGIKTPNRHYFELSFLYHLLGREGSKHKPLLDKKPDYVVFGICLGMQSMSVATGGDMYQDIPSDIYGLKYVEDVLAMDKNNIHRSYWRNIDTDKTLDGHSFHKIKLIDNQFFTNQFGLKGDEQPTVVSSHHQAVKNIGKGFEVAATSIDGKVIEAIYHNKYPNVLGVQFHPEFYTLHDPDSKKMKLSPNDKELMSEYEMMKKAGSYWFHEKYWKYFSGLFVRE